MKKFLGGALIGVMAVVGFAMWSGAIALHWPWRVLPQFGEVDVAISLPAEARIVSIEPIALDCRARVHAEVPVEGRREHSLFDQVYRVDMLRMNAIGDVDTCVEGPSAQVVHRRDGSTEVIIPGDSIKFVRPRVDTVATASSVEVGKGLVGKMTDIFPWVSDDLGLTPLAYAYAQNVIGGSACMQTAYSVTEELLVDAYRRQFIDQGSDPEKLTVRIDGEPTFDDPPPLDLGDDVELNVAGTDITCTLSDSPDDTANPDR